MKQLNKRILFVEDDKNLGYVVKDFLELSGYTVTHKENGMDGLKAFRQSIFDLCILDILLPLKDGFTLAAEIRQQDAQIPIIFFTSKNLTTDKIKGFKIGGDDYITKPFSIEELLSRIEALLRRVQGGSSREDVCRYEIGNYIFDYSNSLLIHGEMKTALSHKETELLKLLCVKKNQLVKRETALSAIWGENDYFLGRSMDVFISKLRKHLAKDPQVAITNMHGVGFMLETGMTKEVPQSFTG